MRGMLRYLCLALLLRGVQLMDNSTLEIFIDTIPPGPIFPVAAIVSLQCSIEMEHSVESYDWEFYCMFQGDLLFVTALRDLPYPGGYNLHFLSTSEICIDVVVCSATDSMGNVGEASVVLSNVTGVGLAGSFQLPLPNNSALFADTSGLVGTITCHSASSDPGIGIWFSPHGLNLSTTSSSLFEVGFSVGRVHSFTSIEVQRELSLSENDGGVYSCVIPDENGQLFTLNIGLYPNNYNSSLRWVSAGRVSENPFTLFCTSTDLPATTVSWEDVTQATVFVEGEDYHMDLVVDDRVTSTYTSFLTVNAPLDVALLYACVVQSSMIYTGGNQSETAIVNFFAILQVGRTGSVSCLINASRVEWTFNGVLYSTDSDIHILAEDINHNGVFICTGYSSESQIIGIEYITAIVNVPETAITLSASGNTQVILGELLQVQCIVRYNVGGLSQTASLELLDSNNDTVGAGVVLDFGTTELTLTASFGPALIAHAGQYTCVSALSSPALDSPLEKSLPVSITVQIPMPDVSLTATPSTVLLSGSDVQITCRSEISPFIKNDVNISIAWKREGDPLESSSSVTIEISDVQETADRIYESILTLRSASNSQDSGVLFTCESTITTNATSPFIVGSQTATAMVSLTINVPPLTVSTSPDMHTVLSVAPYNDVTVICDIMAPSEVEYEKFIIWERESVENGEIVALSQDNASVSIVTVDTDEPFSYYSRLSVNESIPGDYVYTCRVKIVLPRDENVIAFASTEITVKGSQAPTKPTNVGVSSVTSESANVSWIIPHITFTPEYYTLYYGREESNLDNSIMKLGAKDIFATDTAYTVMLNNLLPDTLYYYRVVSHNSELSTETSIRTFMTLASGDCSAVIQLVFGAVHDCNEWRFDDTDVLLQEVQSSVIIGVNDFCSDQCELVPSSLSRAEFLCSSENTEVVFYRVMLSGEGEAYCSNLVAATESWVRGEEASVLVRGNRIFIDSECTVGIESFADPIECVVGATSPTTMPPQQRSSAVVGAGIGVGLTLVGVLVGIVVVVVIVVRYKRNTRRGRISNAEYSMNSAYGTHAMDSMMAERQLNNPLYRDHRFVHQEGTGSYINHGPYAPNQVDSEGYTFMNPNLPDPPSYSEVAKMMEANTYSELTNVPDKSSDLPLPPINETADQESLYEEIGPGSLQTEEQEVENGELSASYAANPLYGSSTTK